MDRSERHQVDTFWRLTDDVLNAVLFVLIGIHVLLVPHWIGWPLAVTAVSLGLGGRLIGVLVSTAVFRPHRQAHDMVWWDLVALLTWGGLRGGVSVALALTLPDGATRDLLLEFAYIIVLFSILVQGLTMGRLFDKASLRKMSERARAL